RYSPSNPGVPITYSIRYLKDRRPARLSLTTQFDKSDCVYEDTRAGVPLSSIPFFVPRWDRIDDRDYYYEVVLDYVVEMRVTEARDGIEARLTLLARESTGGVPVRGRTSA